MKRLFWPIVLAVVSISGCGSLGLQPPKTFEDHIANAYTSLSAARDTSTTLAQAGKLTKADFADFIKQCDSAREAIEAARVLHGTDVTAGQERLDVAITILTALNAYLSKREAGPPATPEVTSYENPRRPARLHHPHGFADEGSAVIYLAAASRSRGARDQLGRAGSVGLGGRCGEGASKVAA